MGTFSAGHIRHAVVIGALVGGLLAGAVPAPAVGAQPNPAQPSSVPASTALSSNAAAATSLDLTVTTVVSGLTIPWDLLFTPDGTMIYNQRAGGLWARQTNGTTTKLTADFSDLQVDGEVGLMGMAVDPDFATNRTIYTCQGHRAATPGGVPEIWVVKWSVNSGYTAATRSGAPLISGIAQTHNTHAGCRLRFDSTKLLYISTGDSAEGLNPQNLSVLNGKTLRINRDGTPAAGNPYLGSSNPRTRLIYSSGHRNVQGLSLRPGSNEMWSVEQGTDRDDEVNRLVSGGNYGWDPHQPGQTGYDQTTPMTNPAVPGAIPAVYTTGYPTLALSGGAWLSGTQWGPWNGAFVAAALKDTSVRILSISTSGALVHLDSPPELAGTYGRLRSPLQGPDGALYITTSNGGGTDRILRVTAKGGPGDGRCYGDGPDPATPVAAVTTGSTTTGYVIGTNRALYSRSIDGGDFTDLGGITKYGPGAVTWDGSRTDVFVIGTDNALYHRFQPAVGAVWSAWEYLGGALTSSPAAVSFAGDRLTIFARGTDGALWKIDWTGSRWSGWALLGGRLSGGPAAAVDRDTRTAKVGVRGIGGELYELTMNSAGGASAFTPTGVPVCGPPGYATRTGDGRNFSWATTDADGASAVINNDTITGIGAVLRGTTALVTPGARGYAVLGRGTDDQLWVYDARNGTGAWRALGGQIR